MNHPDESSSPITCDVDLDAVGKHAGNLRLPHSVHRSAYGYLPLPVVSIKHGSGPTVLLMAGNHGDEYEGQVALCTLARSIAPECVTGQLIILPMANAPAARAGLRTSPLDGGNLNRSFPGDPNGSPTAVIAHYIEHELLRRSDFLLDIHSGGSSLRYRPTLLMAVDGRPEVGQLELLRSLGFERAVIFAASRSGNYSSSAAERQGAVAITAEMAGGGNIEPTALTTIEKGLSGYLRHTGVVRTAEPVSPESATRILQIEGPDHYLYSHLDGLFEPLAQLGDRVDVGQPAAKIHNPARPLDEPEIIVFGMAGEVICERVPAQVQHGDCLFEIAADYRATGR